MGGVAYAEKEQQKARAAAYEKARRDAMTPEQRAAEDKASDAYGEMVIGVMAPVGQAMAESGMLDSPCDKVKEAFRGDYRAIQDYGC